MPNRNNTNTVRQSRFQPLPCRLSWQYIVLPAANSLHRQEIGIAGLQGTSGRKIFGWFCADGGQTIHCIVKWRLCKSAEKICSEARSYCSCSASAPCDKQLPFLVLGHFFAVRFSATIKRRGESPPADYISNYQNWISKLISPQYFALYYCLAQILSFTKNLGIGLLTFFYKWSVHYSGQIGKNCHICRYQEFW